MMTPKNQITVTAQDMERLQKLLDSSSTNRDSRAYAALDEELARCQVVDQSEIPPCVVTMNSRVVFEDEESRQRREITLVYPAAANVGENKISVLAPVGTALLGLSVGQSIEWPVSEQRAARLRIIEVIYQPESSGKI